VDKRRINAQIYLWTVIAGGAAILLGLGIFGQYSGSVALLILFVACACSEWLVVDLPQGDRLTLSIIFVLLAVVFGDDRLSPFRQAVGALTVIAAGSLIGYGLAHRPPLLRLLFYVAHYVWAAFLAGLIFVLIIEQVPSFFVDSFHLPAVVGYTLVFSLVSGVMVTQFNARNLIGDRLPKADLAYTIFLAPIALIVYYFFQTRDLSIWSLLLLAFPLIGVLATFRLYINIDTTYSEVRQLYQISCEFVAAMSEDAVVETAGSTIAQAIAKLIPQLDVCLVYVRNEESNEYVLANPEDQTRGPRVILPGHGLLGQIAVEGAGTIVNDVTTERPDAQTEWPWPPETALLGYPMFAEKQQAGLLLLTRHKKKFTPQEFRLVGIVANQAAVALHNATLYEHTQHLADKDRLLGVFNQAAFSQRAKRILSQAGQANKDVAMLYPDIDDFRLVNNTYGHPTGDKVLIGVANVMENVVNGTGIVGRSGGEEFFILLPNTDEQNALDVADQIRAQVQEHTFYSLDHQKVHVTLSIGVALFPRDAGDFESLKKQADRAAYLAKRMGKNRVCLYQDRKEIFATNASAPELAQMESVS
jgi:diguanylate cyclase (GGDEF)-like protein